ncbi:hypothetical protein DFH06DRAFT_1130294 [Mycena polygramma]|nr:hypothetical protein DFH06DRAFT_1130294 [Mycena polygramma]
MSSHPPIPPNIGERTAPETSLLNFPSAAAYLDGILALWHVVQLRPNGFVACPSIPLLPRLPAGSDDHEMHRVYGFRGGNRANGDHELFAYTIFGPGYGNLDVFDKSELERFPVCILGSLVAGIVQLFYVYRVLGFSGSRIIGGAVTLLALLQICSGIAQGVISKLATERSHLEGKPINVTIWLTSSALCDLAIAGVMAFYVCSSRRNLRISWLNHHSPVQLKRTSVISTRMKNMIARIPAALCAAIQLIVFLTLPTKNYFETPSWTLGKLYSNNLLVLLNSRTVAVGGRDYTASAEVTNDIAFNTGGTTDMRRNTMSLQLQPSETQVSNQSRDVPPKRYTASSIGMDHESVKA